VKVAFFIHVPSSRLHVKLEEGSILFFYQDIEGLTEFQRKLFLSGSFCLHINYFYNKRKHGNIQYIKIPEKKLHSNKIRNKALLLIKNTDVGS
jgi:hypothetical protein